MSQTNAIASAIALSSAAKNRFAQRVVYSKSGLQTGLVEPLTRCCQKVCAVG
jgi:hypothetical protein